MYNALNEGKGKISNKLYNCSMAIKYLHNKIINNQEIRRLMYYNTKSPLANRSIGYDGIKVDQVDVTEEQVKNIITDFPFSPEMDLDEKSKIFINLPTANFNNGSELFVYIHIIAPIDYYHIDLGYRPFEIAQRIINEIDCKYLEGEYGDIGNGLEFKVLNVYTERLTKKQNYIWTSLKCQLTQVPIVRR